MPARPTLLLTLLLSPLGGCHPSRPAPWASQELSTTELRLTPETARLEPAARALAIQLGAQAFRARFDSLLALSPLVPVGPLQAGVHAWVPVPAHRAIWSKRRRILVAAWAGGLPVAFGPEGDRHLLDPTRPPRTPVVLIGPPGSRPAHPPAWLKQEPAPCSPLTHPNPYGGISCDSRDSPCSRRPAC